MKLHTLTMAVALGLVTAPAFATTDVDALEKRINELEQRLEQTEKVSTEANESGFICHFSETPHFRISGFRQRAFPRAKLRAWGLPRCITED